MLNAVGYDARGQMYVVASALVSGEENNENVRWFLRELLCDGINTPSFIMSDRGSALLSSVTAVYPSKCMFINIITIKIISSAPPPSPFIHNRCSAPLLRKTYGAQPGGCGWKRRRFAIVGIGSGDDGGGCGQHT